MASENYYKILGIDRDAQEIEIRLAYYEKAKRYHPDAENGDRQHFEYIQNAYQALLDPKSRAEHDRALESLVVSESSIVSQHKNPHPIAQNETSKLDCDQQGFTRRFLNNFFSLFSKKTKREQEHSASLSPDISRSEISEKDYLSATIINKNLTVYSEYSLPLAVNQILKLDCPQDPKIVKRCAETLAETFQNYPIIDRAVMIEIKPSAETEAASRLLILIEKEISKNSGIDDLRSVEIKNYPDHLPDLLLCSAVPEGPFSEAVKLYGIEFYPALQASNLN